MKVIAKESFENKFTESKWTKDNKYNVIIDKTFYLTRIIDDNNKEILFCGEPKHLEDKFEFVEE